MIDTAKYHLFPELLTLLRDLIAHARWRAARTLATMLAGAVLEGFGLALLVPLLAVLAGDGGGAVAMATRGVLARIGVDGQVGRLAVLLAGFVALILLRALVLARRDRMMAELQVGFVERRRARLLAALGAARWGDIAGLRHARVLHALDDNVERTAGSVQMLFQLAAAAAMLAVQWLLVLALAPAMAGASLLLIAIGGAALLPVVRRAARTGHGMAGDRLRLFDGAAQLLGGLKLAMAQNLQHAFIAEFEATAAGLMRDRLDHMRRFSRSRILGTTTAALAGAALILAGVWYGTPLVSLIAALAIFTRMVGPATVVQQIAQQITSYLPGYAALRTLTDELEASGAGSIAPRPVPIRARIVLENASYTHGEGGAGLCDVSIAIESGEILGVIGPSGAGKTTFADLIAGLLVPDSGAIRVGNTPLDARTAASWRDGIAYVGQDSYLFNDSIRRNLALGLGDTDDARLWRTLDLVDAGDLVRSMPAGLDTVVAERGARLSGGQRQRIALARALLRRPGLLILDEATNAIDVAGEAAIFDRLAALDPRPTIVVIAHRGETLARCGRLIRIEDGRIVADAPLVAAQQQA